MSTGTTIKKTDAPWTEADEKKLQELEERFLPIAGSWVDGSEILAEMLVCKIYRKTHDTFADYLDERWGISRSWGYKLAKAGKIVQSLPPGSERPTSVRATLALADGTDAPKTDEPPGLTRARANGHVPADAEVTRERPEAPPITEETEEPEVTTEDWLATLPARAKLSDRCRRLFDLEAVVCERLGAARKRYRDECRQLTEPLEKEGKGVGPWLAKHHLHFKINGPSKWRACEDCGGTGFRTLGGETGQCGTCKTMGYHV